MCQDLWWSEESPAQESDVHWLKQRVPGGLAGLNWEGGIPSPESDLGTFNVDIPSLQLVSRFPWGFPYGHCPSLLPS